METLHEYMKEAVTRWNGRERLDKSFEIKVKRKENKVSVYYVGDMGHPELTWNFVFRVEKNKDNYTFGFFLDVEEEIIDSLIQSGYKYKMKDWFKEFKITVSTFDEVKSFLDKHVWCHDPGYFY